MDTVLVKCSSCGKVNRVIRDKFKLKPKCHECKKVLEYPNRPIDITGSMFKEVVLDNPGITLVDFWSQGCGYCMMLNPVLEQIAAEFAGSVKVVKINAGNEQALSAQFQIRGVPALFLFNDGVKIAESAGYMDKEKLVQWIRSKTGL